MASFTLPYTTNSPSGRVGRSRTKGWRVEGLVDDMRPGAGWYWTIDGWKVVVGRMKGIGKVRIKSVFGSVSLGNQCLRNAQLGYERRVMFLRRLLWNWIRTADLRDDWSWITADLPDDWS